MSLNGENTCSANDAPNLGATASWIFRVDEKLARLPDNQSIELSKRRDQSALVSLFMMSIC